MPKLLIINVSANWGSTGKIAEQIGVKVQDNGWDVYYAHGSRFIRPSQLKLIEVGSKYSDYIHYIWNSFILGSQGLGSKRETQQFVDKIKELAPDIIHIHNLHGYYINYKVLFEYLNTTTIKVVWTLHDCWPFTGHCTNPTITDCNKWIIGCHKCSIRYEYPRSLLDKSKHDYILKKTLFENNTNLMLVTVSEWQNQLLEKSFLANKPRIVINNGTDVKQFNNPGFSKFERYTIIGVSSVWDKSKGLYDYYELRKLLPEDKYDIILVGLKKKQLKSIPSGIRCITRTESVAELVELYSRSHVFVNPTYEDTFPTVNLEALACGTPVITYRTGGAPEAVDEKTGIVVSQGNILELAEKIKWMELHGLSSVDCRVRAENLFNKDTCYEKYLNLFNLLLSKQ